MQHWTWCFGLDCFANWADTWQTMITGVAAVGAAYASLKATRRQITSGERQEQQRRQSRVAASRLRLSLALSDVIDFANQCLQLWRSCLDAEGNRTTMRALATQPRPSLPEAPVLLFADLVENTDDRQFSAYLTSMVREMQVHNSRVRQFATDASMLLGPSLESYAMQAAMIYGYAAGLYPYARGETADPPHRLDWDFVITGLNLSDLRSVDYASLHAFVGRARARAEESRDDS